MTEKKSLKEYSFDLFINAEMTPREPAYQFADLSFGCLSPNFYLAISFSLFVSFFTISALQSPLTPSLLRYRPRYSEATDSTQLSDWLVESILLSWMWNYPRKTTKEERSRKTHSWKVEDYTVGGECGRISEKELEPEKANSTYRKTEFCGETFI